MCKKPWDELVQKVIDAVQAVIKAAFPEVGFHVHCRDDPEGIYTDAYMQADNGFDILDLIDDHLVDLCVEEGLHSYMISRLKAEP